MGGIAVPYKLDINAADYSDSDSCVVASAPVLADLTAAITGWNTATSDWGFATRDGGTPSTFRFVREVFNQCPAPGAVIVNGGPSGGQPLAGSVTWSVTTFGAATPSVGDYLMVPMPGKNEWRLSRVMSVPA
jgi:hypothetical protein